MKARILQVIPSFRRTGAASQLLLLAAGLPRERYDVLVCALAAGGTLRGELEKRGVATTVVGHSRKVDPHTVWRLNRLIRQWKPDLLHTWYPAAARYAALAARLAGGAALVADSPCMGPSRPLYERVLDRWLLRSADPVVFTSWAQREDGCAYGLDPRKTAVIPPGIECPAAEAADNGGRAGLLAELALPAETILIAAVGALVKRNRMRDLLWAIELLGHVHPSTHLLIVGEGPERLRLERFMQQIHLRRASLLGERNDVARLLSHSFCLWHAGSSAGVPLALMEGMAAGLPVVAADSLGSRELVRPSENGYLFPPGDRAAVAKCNNELLGDRDLAVRLGQAGRQRIGCDFSAASMVQRYAALYEELLEERQ